ncbi:nucleoside triphosphate pyrophosphohydrolase [Haliangium sp.]|uniref:nucleoside triphosphate pyrophosphohydrolase n=1 Tax=Haliangium sp. TaxID=2663208 RepID=UPI003D0D9DC5
MALSNPPGHRRGHTLPALVEVMARLLGPDGCPWDREQSLESLIPFLIEEAYEVIEAIETGHPDEHCEELGDLLMQVVFQAALQQAEGRFDIDDVIAGITDKLIRRHPHVFADADAATSSEVVAQWEAIKAEEKRARNQAARPRRVLDGVPAPLPALPQAHKISARVAKVGFDWDDAAGCLRKVGEEMDEVERAAASGDADAVEAEIGDLLFAVVSLARKLDCDPETALRRANRRFMRRFAYVEDRLHDAGRSPADASLAEMDALWDQAKATLEE